MGFFGNLWSGLTNGVREFVRDPVGKIKSIGTAVVNGIGKVKNVVGFIKKGADFVRNIPVIGDFVRNAPILSNIGNAIDTVDHRVNQISGYANAGNNLIQRIPQ